MQAHPHPGGLRYQLNPDQNNPTLKPGGLSNGDSPAALRSEGVRMSDDDALYLASWPALRTPKA
jgi:hypothetical protein